MLGHPSSMAMAAAAALLHLPLPLPIRPLPSRRFLSISARPLHLSRHVSCCSLPVVAIEAEPTKGDAFTPQARIPELSIKEKKELASYAHSLGKKLKIQQVGKSGVTPNVAASFVETLEANELLKLKVHNSCPGELPDVVRQLEVATGSVAVGLIGRSVILYRPSITKMKDAERKKLRVQKVKKDLELSSFEPKEQARRLAGRGRRGSSRVNSSSVNSIIGFKING